MTLFAGMGGHQSAKGTTDEWLTPFPVLQAMGGGESFDLDPCAPTVRPWPMARQHFTVQDNGLIKRWFGRVWLNPPYGSAIGAWLARMAEHNHGIALIFARTDTEAFRNYVWREASALLFLHGRLNFVDVFGNPRRRKRDGRDQNSGAPSVLCAYGSSDTDVLADCGLDGTFVPLRLPRGVLILAPSPIWRDLVHEVVRQQRGPIALADLYRFVRSHPKTRANPNWRAKIRQTLQQGPFRRVARGQWECAA